MTVSFETVTLVPGPVEQVFDLSLDVDLHQASMASSDEHIVGGVATGGMRLGDTVTWRARHFGIWWTMTSTISAYERPGRFVDEQVRGPFRRFRHEHLFEVADGGTRMTDLIEFDAPFGPLGRLVERVGLGRHLRHLIELRNAELVRAFSDGTHPA